MMVDRAREYLLVSGCAATGPTDDPRGWRLDIPHDRIALYLKLTDLPGALTVDEATMLVELVDAWRALEHRKHLALMNARP
jgi:hypothetical protein